MNFSTFCSIIAIVFSQQLCSATLYPRESETREAVPLDGIWNFRSIPNAEDNNIGFAQKWYSQPLKKTGNVIPMAVPSSYQDLVEDRETMDNWGWVWYDKQFFPPKRWLDDKRKIILRFSSVRLNCVVYLNGVNIVNHTGGQLPFEVDVTNNLNKDKLNLLTVAVNNVLSNETLPQGKITYMTDTKLYPKGFAETKQNFDFFNYAGIDRSVHLYGIPQTSIKDITTVTSISNTTGVIDYNVVYDSKEEIKSMQLMIEVFDENDVSIKNQTSDLKGKIEIANAQLWWPYTMNKVVGYQYLIKFSLINDKTILDTYYQKVGIRTVKLTESQFLINDKPFYFRGFGKHEDSNIHGKGLDLPLIVKDFNLIKWLGANSFRTSHYPYSEELMDQSDSQGIVVIDETPATGVNYFGDSVLKLHMQIFHELYTRDKNRPSVVMWSLANEPNASDKSSDDYFKKLVQFSKTLEKSRPISATTYHGFDNCLIAKHLDVLMINRYYGWYTDKGYTRPITQRLVADLEEWHKVYKKPMILSEYGADTSNGLHDTPSHIYSEDFQTEVFMEYFKGFDIMRANDYFVGELVWNFADFKCNREINENWGIFTRERRPKASAKVIRCRYWKLSGKLSEVADSDFYCPAV
jgi:beta-glucuronidase